MFYEQQPFEDLTDAYVADMRAGLRGEASTLMMLPSFLPAASARRARARAFSCSMLKRHESARRTRPL